MMYTIGYEGLNVPAFVNELKDRGIRVLIDVRQMPLSRKKGFSKRALAAAVEAEGMEYRHIRELGAPRDVRYQLRATGDWAEYCQGYFSHLDACDTGLEEVVTLAASQAVCLMCFEADYTTCHRSLITSRLQEQGLVLHTVHLTPQIANFASERVVA
jgi:uncharacterized protein (DUF488 family)